MRRLILIAVCSGALAACGGGSNTPPGQRPENTATPTEPAAAATTPAGAATTPTPAPTPTTAANPCPVDAAICDFAKRVEYEYREGDPRTLLSPKSVRSSGWLRRSPAGPKTMPERC